MGGKRNILFSLLCFYLNEEEYRDDFFYVPPFPVRNYLKEYNGRRVRPQVNSEEYMVFPPWEAWRGRKRYKVHFSSVQRNFRHQKFLWRLADILLEEFPDRKIEIIDSLSVRLWTLVIRSVIWEIRTFYGGSGAEKILEYRNLLQDTFKSSVSFILGEWRISKASVFIGVLWIFVPLLWLWKREPQSLLKRQEEKAGL